MYSESCDHHAVCSLPHVSQQVRNQQASLLSYQGSCNEIGNRLKSQQVTDQQVRTSRQKKTQSQWLANEVLHRNENEFHSLRATDRTSRYLISRSMHLLSQHVTILDLAMKRWKTKKCTCVFWLQISVHDMFLEMAIRFDTSRHCL